MRDFSLKPKPDLINVIELKCIALNKKWWATRKGPHLRYKISGVKQDDINIICGFKVKIN